jgi:hypothetical protein
MLRTIARTIQLVPLAVLHIACSAPRELAAEDPYASCVDLGDLSVQSFNRADAERAMRDRVRELGGDTLLFGERGRSERLSDAPAEIVARRDQRLAADAAADAARPAIVATEEQPEDESATAEGNAARRQSAPILAAANQGPLRELWFYGAALRCNSSRTSP